MYLIYLNKMFIQLLIEQNIQNNNTAIKLYVTGKDIRSQLVPALPLFPGSGCQLCGFD